MSARRIRHLALFAVPALASCSFLLDFDSLQEGTGGSAGSRSGSGGGGAVSGKPSGGSSGSTSGTAGEGASAGDLGAGGVACPSECFHDDPCLVSGCTPEGECKGGTNVGLVLDGVDETVPAATHYRVTLASGDDAFFLSAYAENGGKKELTFYRLAAKGDTLTPIGSLGGLNLGKMGDPASAAGLVVDTGLGLIHAFVALDDRSGTGARVWHLVMDMSFQVQTPTPASGLTEGYWATSPYSYPVALYTDGQVYGAWINADGSISLSDGSIQPPKRLADGMQATTLSLFASTDGQPHVLYGAYASGVFIERPGLAALQLTECQDQPGAYVSSSATFTGLTGLWVGAWTKVPLADTTDGFLTTNGRAFVCGKDGCGSDMTACKPSDPNNLIRNPATVIVHRPEDPTGLVELVEAVPFIGTDNGGNQGNLMLLQQSIRYGNPPFMDPPLVEDIAPSIPLASQEALPPNFRGPDFPTVGFVPPDHFAVSWIQPAETTGDELRVQRYRMCLPAASGR